MQRSMKYWDAIHPFNGTGAVEIGPELSQMELDFRWRSLLDELGWSEDSLICRTVDGSSQDWLNEALSRELNARFMESENPLRLALYDQPATGRRWLGITYRHAIADGWTIAMLYKRLLEFEQDFAAATVSSSFTPVTSYLGELYRQWRLFRRCGTPTWSRHYSQRELTSFAGEVPIELIIRQAKRLHVTVNDLLVGAIVQALQNVKPDWSRHGTRSSLVMVPVNLREPQKRYDFGQFLGSWLFDVPPSQTFEHSVMQIHQITRSAKGSGEAVRGLCSFDLIPKFELSWLGNPVARLARRVSPVAAIISNLNLSSFFQEAEEQGLIRSYTRTSSPGDMSPMTVCATSVRDCCNIRMSAWTECLTQTELQAIVNDTIALLE